MKRIKRVLSILLSAILLSATLTATPVYAQEQNSEVKMEQTIQKSLSAAEKQMQRIAALPIVSVSSYAELVAAIENKTANIYLLQDIQLEAALQIDYDVSFLADLEGKTLYSAPECRHIQITASNVQLQFNKVILDGQYTSGTKLHGGIESTASNITLLNPVIQNCYAKSTAVVNCIPDSDTGEISIYNGIIKNNTVSSGSAMCLYADNIVIYNTVVENTGKFPKVSSGNGNGGGIEIGSITDENAVTVLIYDSIIRNNTAGTGGGIYVWNANLTLNANTVIENNTAAKIGGGICADNSIIESYAKITNNSAKEHGGGVDLDNSTFILQGGEISYNTAGMTPSNFNHYGGGISISNSNTENQDNIIINDGIIQGNISIIGGGIGYSFLEAYEKPNQPRIIMNGGTICNNGYTVEEDGSLTNICFEGGGIYGSYVELNDGIIEKNICYGEGSGVYAQTNFIMRDGNIQDNGYYEDGDGNITIQTAYGGGVYIYENAAITGGLIYGNQANQGGGMYVFGSLSLSAPAYVRFNNAADVGGGIFFFNESGAADTDLTRIRNNTAANGSDQYSFKQ